MRDRVDGECGRGPAGEPSTLDQSAPNALAEVEADAAFAPGQRIDHFVVVDRLGGGGMGLVVRAYDTQLDRRVAIKVLRPDRHGPADHAGQLRLLREAQAMARLSHPNVVVVHAVGTVGDGVYIAMEHVDGQTLTAWLAAARRSWREVLPVFVQAGRGLAAAHDAGLVHRDVKPDNILVGADGRVRVTDFGLVTSLADPEPPGASAPGVTDHAPLYRSLTRTGALLGTPVYMAPEQHAGAAVTAAADQFSFCVALHEALHGARPFAGGNRGELIASIAGGPLTPRASDLPGWLDGAIRRGLAAAPAARHPSMNALLAALSHDPVATRRRRLVIAGAAVGLAATLTVAALALDRDAGAAPCQGSADRMLGAWDPAVRASIARGFLASGRPGAADVVARVGHLLDRYTGELIEMRIDACRATRVRRDQSEALMDLRIACLDRRVERVRALTTLFAGPPDVEVVDQAISASAALPPVRDCADTAALGATPPSPRDPTVRARVDELRRRLDQAGALHSAGRYPASLELTTVIASEARALADPALLGESLYYLGAAQRDGGDAAAAEVTLGEAAERAARAHDDVTAAEALSALLHTVGGKLARHREGLALIPAARAAVARAGDAPLMRAKLDENIGEVQRIAGDLAGARVSLERAVVGYRQALGDDHQLVATALDSLGLLLAGEGKFEDSRRLHEQALAILERVVGPDHPMVGRALYHIGSSLQDRGRYEEARPYYERSLAVDRRALGPRHPDLAYSLNALGDLLHTLGDVAGARAHLDEALDLWQTALGPDHPLLVFPLNNLGTVLETEGKAVAARAYHQRALAIVEQAFGPDHEDVAEAYFNLAGNSFLQGHLAEAIAEHQRAIAIWERGGGPDHPYVAWSLTGIGECHVAAGAPARAIAPLERALVLREREQGDTVELAKTRFVLARALWDTRRDRTRAAALARQARADADDAGVRGRRLRAAIDGWRARHAPAQG